MKAAMSASPGKRKLPPPVPLAPDWPWIHRQYRLGAKSTREIARESTAKGRKISHVSIEKRAKVDGWTRDLKHEVRARVGVELAADALNAVNRSGASAEEIVEAAARQGADVIRSHRNDIGRLRAVVGGLVDELVSGPREIEDLKAAIIAGTTPKKKATAAQIETAMQRRHRLMKLVGLQSRAVVAKDLSQATGKLVSLERQAFGLNEGEAPDSIEDRLKSLEGDADG